MKKLFCLMLLGSFCLSCDRQVPPPKTPHSTTNHDVGNVTPVDQSSSDADLTITQAIRRQVMDQNDLSTNAKNVKIISREGVVILKGEVNSQNEKNIIEQIANQTQGVRRLDNQIQVGKAYNSPASGR